MTTTIRIQATEAQLAEFENRCQLTERLLAGTLLTRLGLPATPENTELVAGWMSTARSQGIANHVTSGIRMEMVGDQARPQQLGDLRQMALDLCHLIEAAGASPALTAASLKASELHQAINQRMPEALTVDRPTVVCLCGSTRFAEHFRTENLHETIAGRIVLSIGCDTKSDTDLLAFGELTEEAKARLDELHLRKIDLADEILVINVDDYIGESTRREIAYARANGKRVRWWGPTQYSHPGEIAG